MANTLTNLYGELYAALDMVSREMVGLIPAVGINGETSRGAVGQSVRVPVTSAANVSDISASMSVPEPTDQTVTNVEIQITKSRAAEFGFVGEEQLGLKNGAGYNEVQVNMIAQAIRSLVNEIEIDLGLECIKGSRVYGTAGTTPFGSDISAAAQLAKILKDNGGWVPGMMNMIFDTSAGANLGSLTQLTNVNEAGTDQFLRQGVLTQLHGFSMRESAGIATNVAGTGSGYLVNNGAGYAVGDTQIVVDTGTGTILEGNFITFAGDNNKYIVTSGVTGAGTVTIAAPGLRETLADNTAVTVGADYVGNVGLRKDAVQLAARLPAVPEEGDLAIDRMTITDARSGLTMEVAVYPGYRKVRYEVAIAWGVKTIKPEHVAVLAG